MFFAVDVNDVDFRSQELHFFKLTKRIMIVSLFISVSRGSAGSEKDFLCTM